MSKVIELNVGELAVGVKDVTIKTGGIGSCMVVCVYDEKSRAGGMIHAMLPSRRHQGAKQGSIASSEVSTSVAKYVDEGIERLISEVEFAGGKKERMIAKLVGGSRMFKFMSDEKNSIGAKNLEMAQAKLGELGIPISGEDTGGTIGRVAEFNLENGILNIEVKI